jgi:hypothetical protein
VTASGSPKRPRSLAKVRGESIRNPRARQRIVRTLAGIFTAQAHEVLGEIPVSEADLELTALTMTGSLWALLTTWRQRRPGDRP